MELAGEEPVRLIGTDEDVVALAVRARRVIMKHPEFAGELFPKVSRLALDRAACVEASAASAPAESQPASRSARGWAWSLGIGLVAALLASSLMGPPMRGIILKTEITFPVAAALTALAIVTLALAWRLRPVPQHAFVGFLCTMLAVAMIVLLAVYRAIVGSSSGHPYTSTQVTLWLIGIGIVLVEFVLLLVQLGQASGGEVDTADGRGDGRAQEDQLRESATELASAAPASDDSLDTDWQVSLDRLAGVAPESVAHARELGPVAWLVWAAYDGDVDLADV